MLTTSFVALRETALQDKFEMEFNGKTILFNYSMNIFMISHSPDNQNMKWSKGIFRMIDFQRPNLN